MHSRKANIALEDAYKTVEVEEFLNISKFGRSKGYQYISSGVVKSVLVASSREIFALRLCTGAASFVGETAGTSEWARGYR